jgi:RNA polymerase sigma-70 factor (ECF subfamily)
MLEFQSGSEAAFDRIVHSFYGCVRGYLHRYLRDSLRAEDLTQEVFVRVFRSRRRYRPTAGFRTWLYTIASRLAMNEIRGLRRRKRVFADPPELTCGAERSAWASFADRREPSPEARAEGRELEEVLDRLIDELPPNQRAAVLLNRMEDLSYSAVAEALNVTVMAVKSLLMRARETLRERLEKYFDGKPMHFRSPEP